MIPQSFIEELRSVADIESVVAPYTQLKRHGKIMVGLCPFHSEKTGSFVVYPDSQSFYCFGCGEGGDAIGFIRRIENLDYVEAVKFLAEKYGMTVPEDVREDRTAKIKTKILEINREAAKFFHDRLMNSPEGKDPHLYLTQRGLSDATIKHFGLGYSPDSWDSLTNYLHRLGYSFEEMEAAQLSRKGKNGGYYDVFRDRVMFPIIDLRGNVIAFGGRKRSGDGPKYYNSPETAVFNKTKNLFALNFAKKEKNLDSLIMCEGYMDVIAMHQAGLKNAVASLGTSLTSDQCRLASQYVSHVILAYDNDEAGKKATKRAIGLLDEAGIRAKVLAIPKTPDVKDPDEYIKKYGAGMFRKIVNDSKGSTDYELTNAWEKYDIETTEGKIGAINDTIVILSALGNPMEREIWAQKVSEKFGTSKDGIIQQINDRIKRKAKGELKKTPSLDIGTRKISAAVPEKMKFGSEAVVEERLIGILMRFPEECRNTNKIIDCESFVCSLYGKLYKRIAQAYDNGLDVSVSLFGNDFTMEQQSEATRLFHEAREHDYRAEDAYPLATKIAERKNKKTDGEIGMLSQDELTSYIEKLRNSKKGNVGGK